MLALQLGVLTAAALGAALVVAFTRGDRGSTAAYSTSPAAWVLPRLEGDGTVRLRDFHGHPLVVDFFASWCTPCRSELPQFLSVSASLARRVRFAGIDSEENGDGLAMARQYGVTAWPLARDVGGSQQSGLREALESIPGMPVSAFYDADGRLLSVHLGDMTAEELRAQVRQLFRVAA